MHLINSTNSLLTFYIGSSNHTDTTTQQICWWWELSLYWSQYNWFKNSIMNRTDRKATKFPLWSYTQWVYVWDCTSVWTPTSQTARPLQCSSCVELVWDLVLVGRVVSCQPFRRQSGIAPYAWTHLQRQEFFCNQSQV